MGIRARARFEVFKRDRFTCTYCGRSAPDVLLQVDHIHPKAAGGTDDIDNLTTSCFDCNQGKGSRMLEEDVLPGIRADVVDMARRRAEQLRQYREWQDAIEEETSGLRDRVMRYWALAFGGEERIVGGHTQWTCPVAWPAEWAVRRLVGELTLEAIFAAIDTTVWRYQTPSHQRGALRWQDAPRYFHGVCRGRLRDQEQAVEAERIEVAQAVTPQEEALERRDIFRAIDWPKTGMEHVSGPLGRVMDVLMRAREETA